MENKKKISGFTLIEMILSIGMIIIITGTVMQVSRFVDTHKNLTLSASELLSAVRTAQGYTLAGFHPDNASSSHRHICGYGIYIEPASARSVHYQLFYTYITDADFISDQKLCKNDLDYQEYEATSQVVMVERRKLKEGTHFLQQSERDSAFFIAPYGEVNFAGPGHWEFTIVNTADQHNPLARRTIMINELGKVDVN